MKKLSLAARRLVGQPMFALLAQAKTLERQGKKILHFEIGDPSFPSPDIAVTTAKAALDEGLTHYTTSMGLLEFREAICVYINQTRGFMPALEQVVASPANAIVDFVARCVANAGDEIIIPDPGFPTYASVIAYNGFIPVPIPLRAENKFRLQPDDIARKITAKTKLIIINTPQNPTGAVMTEEEIQGVAQLAKKHDVFLLSDEVYSTITYGAVHHSPSVIDHCKTHTILLNSLSKAYSMSGWRLGYAVGPEKLMQKVGLLLETILSCLPPFTQRGGQAVLKAHQGFLNQRIEDLRKRRDILIAGLNQLPGISCVVPEGAFYAFPSTKHTGMTADEYAQKLLLETGVCVLPGSCFGKQGNDFIRLSYASIEPEQITEALEKMRVFHIKHRMKTYTKS